MRKLANRSLTHILVLSLSGAPAAFAPGFAMAQSQDNPVKAFDTFQRPCPTSRSDQAAHSKEMQVAISQMVVPEKNNPADPRLAILRPTDPSVPGWKSPFELKLACVDAKGVRNIETIQIYTPKGQPGPGMFYELTPASAAEISARGGVAAPAPVVKPVAPSTNTAAAPAPVIKPVTPAAAAPTGGMTQQPSQPAAVVVIKPPGNSPAQSGPAPASVPQATPQFSANEELNKLLASYAKNNPQCKVPTEQELQSAKAPEGTVECQRGPNELYESEGKQYRACNDAWGFENDTQEILSSCGAKVLAKKCYDAASQSIVDESISFVKMVTKNKQTGASQLSYRPFCKIAKAGAPGSAYPSVGTDQKLPVNVELPHPAVVATDQNPPSSLPTNHENDGSSELMSALMTGSLVGGGVASLVVGWSAFNRTAVGHWGPLDSTVKGAGSLLRRAGRALIGRGANTAEKAKEDAERLANHARYTEGNTLRQSMAIDLRPDKTLERQIGSGDIVVNKTHAEAAAAARATEEPVVTHVSVPQVKEGSSRTGQVAGAIMRDSGNEAVSQSSAVSVREGYKSLFEGSVLKPTSVNGAGVSVGQ